jgi:malate dehydrogenase (oxaloacetate-decarboxylating)
VKHGAPSCICSDVVTHRTRIRNVYQRPRVVSPDVNGARPAYGRFVHPSASFSATLRVRLANHPGAFARLAATIGEAGGLLGAIDLVRVEADTKLRDVNVLADDESHLAAIVAAVRAGGSADVVRVSDRTFLAHLGGKLEIRPRLPLKTRDDLSMAYTPGVARVSRAIAEEPDDVWNLTIKRNTVAVVSDGSAVLGLGNIGPEAALPVMEGKAVLFKEFADVDAFPICLATQDPDEIVRTVQAIAPVFGGINLEDISAPRCFEIERRLRESLDIPVFHDDQHGTAVVVLAALQNALRVVGKRLEDVRIVTTGCGAAGMAVTRILQNAGARWIVGCDEGGALYRGRPGLNDAKARYAETTNPENLRGSADELLVGADVFIGVSVPGAVSVEGIRGMAPRAIVFALANPTPEVDPESIEGIAEVIATGRSDYPNQINNVLAFPGIFRGALDAQATTIDDGMELAAARAIAESIPARELSSDYIVPSVFNRSVATAVASAVAAAARTAGIARRSAAVAA